MMGTGTCCCHGVTECPWTLDPYVCWHENIAEGMHAFVIAFTSDGTPTDLTDCPFFGAGEAGDTSIEVHSNKQMLFLPEGGSVWRRPTDFEIQGVLTLSSDTVIPDSVYPYEQLRRIESLVLTWGADTLAWKYDATRNALVTDPDLTTVNSMDCCFGAPDEHLGMLITTYFAAVIRREDEYNAGNQATYDATFTGFSGGSFCSDCNTNIVVIDVAGLSLIDGYFFPTSANKGFGVHGGLIEIFPVASGPWRRGQFSPSWSLDSHFQLDALTGTRTHTLSLAGVAAGTTVTIRGITFTAHPTTTTISSREFSIAGTNTQDAQALRSCINDAVFGVPNVTAFGGGSILTLTYPVSYVHLAVSASAPTITVTEVTSSGTAFPGTSTDPYLFALSIFVAACAGEVWYGTIGTTSIIMQDDDQITATELPFTHYTGIGIGTAVYGSVSAFDIYPA